MTQPSPPCPFDQDFLDDLPYDPEVLLFDQLLELDRGGSTVACRMPTPATLPFTRSQRVHPKKHPAHVAGSVIVHATGMLGFIHSYFVLGLRHREGWTGYGSNIHDASFRNLASLGPPVEARCTATKVRAGKTRYVVRYRFEFTQDGEVCYRGDQSAFWMNVGE